MTDGSSRDSNRCALASLYKNEITKLVHLCRRLCVTPWKNKFYVGLDFQFYLNKVGLYFTSSGEIIKDDELDSVKRKQPRHSPFMVVCRTEENH
jgi:hypothetical protein